MLHRPHRISLNKKLTAITMTTFLCLALLIAVIGFFIFQGILKDNVSTSVTFQLQLLSDRISQQLSSADSFSRWCSVSESFSDYLRRDGTSGDPADTLQQELNAEYRTNSSSQAIQRILIFDSDGKSLPLTVPTLPPDTDIRGLLDSSGLFQLLEESGDGLAADCILSPFPPDRGLVFALLRPIYGPSGGEICGYVYMEIPVSVVSTALTRYGFSGEQLIYLNLNGRSYQITPKTVSESSPPSGKGSQMVSCALGFRDWSLTQDVSASLLTAHSPLVPFFLVLIGCLVTGFGILFSFYLNRTLTRPIQMLRSRIHIISNGDFSPDPKIEWEHELGEIGRGINLMASEISHTIERKIAAEHARTELQYEILLNQVNPHFLYNTLNSIKWMATIQGADGIADMTTALARLLKSVSKGAASRITLRDEFSLVDDYFKILQYRYGGTLRLVYDVSDERLYHALILKFTLQPLVENAVFHGLEPRQQTGTIVIRAYFSDDSTCCLEVEDNGVGMTKEQIGDALSQERRNSSGLFHAVGIRNVNERIKFEFGPAYGLRIQSEPEHFTRVILTLPYAPQKETEHV